MLTLPETHPDWNLKIVDVVDLAMKNVERYNFVYSSGKVEESHYTYVGASWSDFMEAIETSGSTLYTGNDGVSAMEMDMKIHTVDMSMAMLMDFENFMIFVILMRFLEILGVRNCRILGSSGGNLLNLGSE